MAVAAVVKLARVLMLAPVMAVLSVRQRRLASTGADVKRPPLVPLFVLAFLACVVLRSTGAAARRGCSPRRSSCRPRSLTAAMFALGAGVHVATIRKVGARPFLLATVSTVWVAAIAFVGVALVA